MKKLLLLLLLPLVGFGQFNPVAFYNYGKQNLVANTFIGGIGGTTNTPALLATKLGISATRIKVFSVIGSDIQCSITGTYVIPDSAFNGNTTITYYIDSANLVSDLGESSFRECSVLSRLEFNGIATLTKSWVIRKESGAINKLFVSLKNCTNVTSVAFYGVNNSDLTLYIPNCTQLGATTGNDLVF